MTKIKTVLAASSALMIMAAAPAFAQDSYGSGTKAPAAKTKVMKEKAKDAMMEKGDAMMKDEAKSYGSGDKAKDAMMEKGDAMMKDEAKSYGSGDKAKDAMMEKGDAMMKKDGMVEDVMMKEDAMMKKGDHMMKDKMTAPAQVQAPVTLNCPAGTKGQADGTCMIVDSRLFGS